MENTSPYRLLIKTDHVELIEIIDYALDNCQGLFYRNNKQIYYDEWQLVREHWLNKVKKRVKLSTELGFSRKDDYFLVYMRFKGYSI